VYGQTCNYGSSTDASDLCDFVRGNNFSSDINADIALERILDVTGMSKRFALKECSNISNCMATTYKGIRYILYDKEFMDAIAERTNSWSSMSILAHEIGHHVNGHTLGETLSLSESRQMELEADEFSGFVMFRLGASLAQAQDAINTLMPSNRVDIYSTHPSRDKRLRAIETGYNKAKGQTSNNDNSTNTLNLTAEDYFYKAYNNKSDWQYKIDNYTKCLRIDPDFGPWAYNNRGYSYRKLGNNEDAIADYTRAIRIDPDYALAYTNRGYLYAKLGNYEEAIADYTRAIRIDPDYASAYNNRGYSYEELGNYEEALADYTRAIRIDPDDALAYNNRGYSYKKLGNNEEAIADYTRAIRIDPDYALSYNNRGYSYEELGNYEEAIADYTRAIRIDPDDALAYKNRGYSYRKLGNNEEAIADYTRAIRIDPDDVWVYNNRGVSKWHLKLDYCSDFKRACGLGDCNNYNTYCK